MKYAFFEIDRKYKELETKLKALTGKKTTGRINEQ